MTTVLFFCTANVSVELIKEFVVESQKPEGTTNIWSLVRDPSQTEFDEGTVGPLDPVETGFLESSVDNLVKFMEGLPEEDETIVNDTLVILDGRSTRDKTVLIHHSVYEMPDDVEDGEWVDEKAIKSWKHWRVPFTSAAYLAMYLENNAYDFVKSWGFTAKKDNFVDQEGVLRLPTLPMKEFDMLDDDGWPA
ncbi:uncharacterized protein BP5553_09633 [Venustampulla echinocandica]|uniref:Uncharacterized protein n=1 Tax=Venustampulla echinocandica TaxID=2656787 RepID=A0A370TBJ2_9HELO|nr:uncharacterized protein BP5553_09633 [Venustampulla echinocandica]RDL31424.1 hypothetical protein BP5553_09633 [Venustampulla echinocandica]